MGIKLLIQIVAMTVTMVLLDGQFPKFLKRFQIAKIHLLNASKGSTWGKAMLP
jgi:hypothetical protein